jgi:hypothetical protein
LDVIQSFVANIANENGRIEVHGTGIASIA